MVCLRCDGSFSYSNTRKPTVKDKYDYLKSFPSKFYLKHIHHRPKLIFLKWNIHVIQTPTWYTCIRKSHVDNTEKKSRLEFCRNYIHSSCFNIGLVSHLGARHAHTNVTLTEVYHTAAKSFHVAPFFYYPQWAQQYWVKWCMIAPYQWEWLHKASEWSSCIMHLPAQYGCMLRGAEKENGPPGESHTGNTWDGRRRMRRAERGGGNKP